MSTTFTLTIADFARLQNVIAKRFRSKAGLFSLQFGLRIIVWLCIGLAGATYARVMREYPEISQSLGTVAVLLVLALLAIVAMPHVAQASLRKFMLAPNGALPIPLWPDCSASNWPSHLLTALSPGFISLQTWLMLRPWL